MKPVMTIEDRKELARTLNQAMRFIRSGLNVVIVKGKPEMYYKLNAAAVSIQEISDELAQQRFSWLEE